MSVINQMLKDLEKRNSEAGEQTPSARVIVAQSSNKPSMMVATIIVSVVVTLVLAAALWLYQENQMLKQHQASSGNELILQNQQAQQLVEAVEKIAQSSKSVKETAAQTTQSKTVETTAQPLTNEVVEQPKTQVATIDASESLPQQPLAANLQQTSQSENLSKATQIAVQPSSTPEPIITDTAPAKKPSLSIARKQLTSSELAEQKIAKVEKALFDKDGELAEQLLQDALLLAPKHIEARKKLAAIWYAKQSYRATVNLLNQGISELPQEPDFRLMKAKILMQQNLAEQALNTLTPLANLPHIDYQALIANAANATQQMPAAIAAYQQLISLQPNKGKWHLGLAIAFDRNSQFEQATAAYQQAISSGDLSSQSQQFAQQRIVELGE